MKLKKCNAILSLLAVLLLLVHLVYSCFEYLTFYYNPLLTKLLAIPFMVVACLHAVCGMGIVFLQSDGTRMDLYPKLNARTVLQRISAALIFPLLILHINTFDLLQASAEAGHTVFTLLLMLAGPVFFAAAITHVSTSFSRALITLGLLTSPKKQKTLDTAVYIVGAVAFLAASFAVVRTQAIMFLH